MNAEWLRQVGLAWLAALEEDGGFAESVFNGVAVRGPVPTAVTQSRLGYCWSHLALLLRNTRTTETGASVVTTRMVDRAGPCALFPERPEFARAADKSFALICQDEFAPASDDFRVYDHSFFLLFMAWYFRLTGEPAAIRHLKARYSAIEMHLDNAGVGGFGPQPAGLRSHNPYMHLLEALLAAFQSTRDEYWLTQALSIEDLFFTRLLGISHVSGDGPVVFEFLNADWSVAGEGRVEIGHQLEWPTLLLELSDLTGKPRLRTTADLLYEFALRHGFDNGGVIDAVDAGGRPIDRRKLLWSQLEAARHFSVRAKRLHDDTARERAISQWQDIRTQFFHANGWTWYNRIGADGVPIEEPSMARLLYHVVTAAADS
jgi:mannose/cellobiose epimerase-like protein (N-acyl-D-glucosamine 2-epimerase family)